MTLTVEEQVFEFKVTIDDRVLVKVSQSENDFRSVESRTMLGETSFARKVEEQFTAVDVLHDEAQVMRRRERVPVEGWIQNLSLN